MMTTRSEVQDGMRIDWNVEIEMDDGNVLRADVFRPIAEGKYPVIMSYGPYGKGYSFQEGYPNAWEKMVSDYPEILHGSTNKYQSWEVVDPEKWVPDGYAIVRVDSRGAGCSPGILEKFSAREHQDFYQCIEWAGVQPWSNGKVGLNGISYYGVSQWFVGSLQPPHLAAMCVWEGYTDWYRDSSHHGGILNNAMERGWIERQLKVVQYGRGLRGPRSVVTGEPTCGEVTLSEKELAKNFYDHAEAALEHPLDDEFYRPRQPKYDKITYPLLACSNWGGPLHCRGTIEGFVRAASEQKWLEIHGDAHQSLFYSNYGISLQKRFFDYFLKGKDNGWDKQPKVQLQVRHIDENFVERHEDEWPIARTEWTKFYLHPNRQLSKNPPGESKTIDFEAMGEGLVFLTDPFEKETEITGPAAAKLFASSSTTDADFFLVLRLFSAEMLECFWQGSVDPNTPVDFGWLRASHRKLDPELSTFYRPYHAHDEAQPLQPGVPIELDVELWPTSIVVPAGYRIGLSIRGKDYRNTKKSSGIKLSHFRNEMVGTGPFLHNDPLDRKPGIFDGTTTIHIDPDNAPYLLLPVIPEK